MFSENWHDQVNLVVNGCKDCPLFLYDKGDMKKICYITKFKMSEKQEKELRSSERPNSCPLPISSGFIRIAPHSYADTVNFNEPLTSKKNK